MPGTGAPGEYTGEDLCMNYDPFGNRTQSDLQSTTCNPSSDPATANYNGANQVTWTTVNSAANGFKYDAAGNVLYDGLKYYAYDGEGRLCAMQTYLYTGGVAAYGYVYDAEGRRVAKGAITPSGNPNAQPPSCNLASNGFTLTESYLLGEGGEQLTTTIWNGSTSTWTRSNLYGAGQLLGTYDTAGLHFHIADPLGTRRLQTNASGEPELDCQSLPFGDQQNCFSDPNAPDGGGDATPLHFTGKQRDSESALDYFGARYYGSSMGRFLSPDPAWLFAADPNNPQSWNLYSYALNNPLINIDPTGYDCVYLNNAGNGVESTDTNSNFGECDNNGGYWVDGTFTSGTVYSNSNDVYLHGTENGQLTDAYYNSVSANGSNNSPDTVLTTPNIFPFNPQKPIPTPLMNQLIHSLNRSGQSDALVGCIASHESSDVTSAATPPPNTAKGLMQVNNGGAADVARLDAIGVGRGGSSGFGGANAGQIASQLFDPAVNIAAGTVLLSAKINLYNGGNVEAGVAAYGTGDAYAKARMACAAGH
jgi:RHS repeat-associated protein